MRPSSAPGHGQLAVARHCRWVGSEWGPSSTHPRPWPARGACATRNCRHHVGPNATTSKHSMSRIAWAYLMAIFAELQRTRLRLVFGYQASRPRTKGTEEGEINHKNRGRGKRRDGTPTFPLTSRPKACASDKTCTRPKSANFSKKRERGAWESQRHSGCGCFSLIPPPYFHVRSFLPLGIMEFGCGVVKLLCMQCPFSDPDL